MRIKMTTNNDKDLFDEDEDIRVLESFGEGCVFGCWEALERVMKKLNRINEKLDWDKKCPL